MNAFEILKERGFIAQTTHEEEIKDLFGKEKVTFYVGFDPTADSLTAGHFVPIMAMAHLQRAGHRPIALVGGATVRIGDPTGRTDMRKMLDNEQIDQNVANFKQQLSKFIDFSDDKAIMVDNSEWLMKLNYMEFMSKIGLHFSVNRMLGAECYKSRYEKGLTFLEFNYMIMQSYDFLELNTRYGCDVQLGGDDQWSNILGGVELIRRVKGKSAYGMTFNLLTTKDGKKMGKTQAGAVWLDPNKTSPFEFYQYWRNVEDEVVSKCLGLLTFLPMDEVKRLSALEGVEINKAKEVLAYELTKIVHGEEEAAKSEKTAKELFYGKGSTNEMPSVEIEKSEIFEGMTITAFLTKISLTPSNSEARRLVIQGGIRINEESIQETKTIIDEGFFKDGEMIVQKGKKTFLKVILK